MCILIYRFNFIIKIKIYTHMFIFNNKVKVDVDHKARI